MKLLARFAAALLGSIVLSHAAYSQDELQARFFQINLPGVDELGNAAMDHLTDGMSNIILALNDGRKKNLPIEPGRAGLATNDFEGARRNLDEMLKKIPLRTVNVEVIHASHFSQAYDDLVALLDKEKLPIPVNSASLVKLLITIINNCEGDIKILTSPPKGGISQEQVVKTFLDLVQQKTFLERLGATSGIITIAMQGGQP